MDHNISLLKAENPAQYARLANEGILLGYPVKIGGQSSRNDNGIHYHSTIKYFDPSKDHAHEVHELAQHLPLNPPDPKNTQIKFDKFKDRLGADVHVITLHGNSADKLKEHNGKFAHMGFPSKFEWTPHISVDKDQWDKLKSSGAKTAHEARIEFGPAQLKKGPKILKTYHHESDTTDPKVPDEGDITAKMTAKSENTIGKKPLMKPYVSEAQRRWAHTANGKKALGGNAGIHEWDEATKGKKLPEHINKSNELEKGALKNAGIALGMAAALAGSNVHAKDSSAVHHAGLKPGRSVASIPGHAGVIPSYDHKKMLGAIAAVESSGGKNTNHAAGGGPIHGNEHAVGKFGLMPETIRETIKAHKDLKSKYGKALALRGDMFHKYMSDNKGLEDIIADRHLAHMEHVLGQNSDHLAYSWLNGVSGALKAKKNGANIGNHWYTKRIRDAYNKEK